MAITGDNVCSTSYLSTFNHNVIVLIVWHDTRNRAYFDDFRDGFNAKRCLKCFIWGHVLLGLELLNQLVENLSTSNGLDSIVNYGQQALVRGTSPAYRAKQDVRVEYDTRNHL